MRPARDKQKRHARLLRPFQNRKGSSVKSGVSAPSIVESIALVIEDSLGWKHSPPAAFSTLYYSFSLISPTLI